MKKAIVINPKDNVASLLAEVNGDEMVSVILDDRSFKFQVKEQIKFGHKFSLKKISEQENVIKYGEVIGFATRDIENGCHVHVHNVESYRGRGDKSS